MKKPALVVSAGFRITSAEEAAPALTSGKTGVRDHGQIHVNQ